MSIDHEFKPGEVFDTVKVDLPGPFGTKFEFFRDIANKNNNLTNMVQVRRLSAYSKLKVERISASLKQWSGDDMSEFAKLFGSVQFQVNRRPVIHCQLSELLGEGKEVDINIVDNDDLNGTLFFSSTPWEEQTTWDWTVGERKSKLDLEWPERVKRFEEKVLEFGAKMGLNLPDLLPKAKLTQTHWEPRKRPKSGSLLVTLHLHGVEQVPVGV